MLLYQLLSEFMCASQFSGGYYSLLLFQVSKKYHFEILCSLRPTLPSHSHTFLHSADMDSFFFVLCPYVPTDMFVIILVLVERHST